MLSYGTETCSSKEQQEVLHLQDIQGKRPKGMGSYYCSEHNIILAGPTLNKEADGPTLHRQLL